LLPEGAPRARAIDTLIRRDPREIVGRLIGMVRKPFTYKVRPIYGMGSVGELLVEGEDYNIYRAYRSQTIGMEYFDNRSAFPALMMAALNEAETLSPQAALLSAAVPDPQFDPSARIVAQANEMARSTQDRKLLPALEMIRQENQVLRQQLASDIQEVEATNAWIKQINERVLPLLAALTGQKMGVEPEKWNNWWSEQVGVTRRKKKPATKPTFTEIIDAPDWTVRGNSCFGAGTPVLTIDGPRPIESIEVGDRVLSQDPTTGRLIFRPVLAVRENPPAATLRISIDGESIVATGIHRFWKAGKGWVMARDLKPGDRLRVVGGTAEIRSIAAEADQPVYNLDVADDRDFFVGTKGLLVHDYSLVQPVAAPFDCEPELTSTAKLAHSAKAP
jgi:hypothetical protein